LAIPLVTLLLLRKKESFKWKLFYGLVLGLFIWLLFMTAAKGAIVAVAVSTVLMLIMLIKNYFSSFVKYGFHFLVIIILILLLMSLFSFDLYQTKYQKNLDLILELFNPETYDDSINTSIIWRSKILKFTLANTIHYPFGYGFQYLYRNYGLDESIIYSLLLNGTGVIGFIAYLFIVGHLFLYFINISIGKSSKYQRELAAIGAGTLAFGLVAGISTESILTNPIIAFLFWSILAVCYGGTQRQKKAVGNER